jgi:charged multivesicular body protein 2A
MNVRSVSCLSPAEIEHIVLMQLVQVLEWAFGKRMTPAERLRKNQRLLDKAIRELDQQRVKLEKQEKSLVAQIKQSAQKGQMGACKIQAKDLVRTRR